jgi:hypothetical protein
MPNEEENLAFLEELMLDREEYSHLAYSEY